MDIVSQHPLFVKDTSKFWYKPKISRDEAISILRDKYPGSFVIRDSNSFPGAFGLALKVAVPPPGVLVKTTDSTELVRHFLIETTAKGVKLKGCNNEPVFGSLSALVYQHSITPLALPCKLLLPECDTTTTASSSVDQFNRAQALLEQGAACNVTYLHSCDTESLTGPEAVRKTVDQALLLCRQAQLHTASVHFKVAAQGITLTDNARKLFFRRHYPVGAVTFCGVDPDERRWTSSPSSSSVSTVPQARIFGFVAKKFASSNNGGGGVGLIGSSCSSNGSNNCSSNENCCHVFAEFETEQPASAIVNFVTKVMMASFRNSSASHQSSANNAGLLAYATA